MTDQRIKSAKQPIKPSYETDASVNAVLPISAGAVAELCSAEYPEEELTIKRDKNGFDAKTNRLLV